MVKNWLVRNEQRKLLTNISGNISGNISCNISGNISGKISGNISGNSFVELHVGGADHQS